VPFAGGPALLAAGWTALALALDKRLVPTARLLVGGLAAAVLALALALLGVFLPVVRATTTPGAAPDVVSLLALVAPPLLALPLGVALASWVGRPSGARGWIAGVVVALLASVLALLPTGLGYVLAPLSVPVVLDTPLVASPGAEPSRSALAAAAAGLVVAVLAGLLLEGRLVS
jgi:hypothetical protein